MGDLAVSGNMAGILLSYIQRNVPDEMQKAIGITVMVNAISKFNCSVTDAANRASDCCGHNPEVVRRWASAFAIACSLENITDECITDTLSSKRGQHNNHAESLINDESFCIEA